MWVSQAALERIRELELALRESVPRAVYDVSLARIAELERRNDWAMDMLLRRGQSFPVPPVKTEEEKPAHVEPAISETVLAQAETIIAEGQRLNLGREEIAEAVQAQTGVSFEMVTAAINGRVM